MPTTPTGEAGLEGYAAPDTPSFTDVAADHWAYRYIEYAAAHGIVQGYGDASYRPALPVTRDQMAMYIARAFRLPM
jgi:5'-nucleotidase/UDP-sugar diphosphatase